MLEYFRKITSRDEDGASAVEYGLLVAAIAAVIVIIVFALGGFIKGAFSTTCKSIGSAPSATGAAVASCS
jgi:pilus assembly protein Flp/PilA